MSAVRGEDVERPMDDSAEAAVGGAVPPARYCQSMVFDGRRTVMFGGAPAAVVGGARLNDTWAFSAGAWQPLHPATSPPARALAASAFDGTRMVLFGGSGVGGGFLKDTWAFDGVDWKQIRTTNGPSARATSMVYDGERIVLFGGYDGRIHDDTWVFDGKTWTQLRPETSPPGRYQAAMAFDGREIVLFGGATYVDGARTPLGDTWTFDGRTWTERRIVDGPIARTDVAVGSDGTRPVMFGGFAGPYDNGLYEYVNEAWVWQDGTWTELDPPISPPPNYAPAMAFDGAELVLFGGSVNGQAIVADTWQLTGGKWRKWTRPTAPSARTGPVMSYDGKRVVLFGGQNETGFLNDTWAFDADGWNQLLPSAVPPARAFASMAYDTERLVLFGGINQVQSNDSLGDTWVFDGRAWARIDAPTSPPARNMAGMAYDGSNVVLFGGLSPWRGDTWIFTGTEWKQVEPSVSPSGRAGPALASLGVRALLFGGADDSGGLGDTWLLDDGPAPEWISVRPADSPSARTAPAMVQYGTGPQALLFGGHLPTGQDTGDTWAFRGDTTGGNWRPIVSPANPPGRAMAGMAYDQGRGLVVLFGGQNEENNFGDTWTFSDDVWSEWLAPTTPLPTLQLTSVTYQSGPPAAVNVALQWTVTPPPSDPRAYFFGSQAYSDAAITIPAGDPVVSVSTTAGSWNPARAKLTLGDERKYWIAAVVAPYGELQDAQPSGGAPILRYPVTLEAVTFDGRYAEVTWVPSPFDAYTGFHVTISVPGGTLLDEDLGPAAYPAGPGGVLCHRFDLSTLPLGAITGPLTLGIAAISTGAARATGPAVTAEIHRTKPSILRTVFGGGTPSTGLQYLVTVLDQGYQSPPRFLASVLSNGTLVQGPTSLQSIFDGNGNPQVILSLPAALPFFAGSTRIPPGLALDVSLAQVDDVSQGPAGPSSPLLLSAPAITDVEYTAGSLAVTIAYPPGSPPQSAARVVVWQGTAAVAQAAITGPAGSVPVTLTSGMTYTATVAALAGQSTGPQSPPVSLMSGVPTLTAAGQDRGIVRASWNPPGTITGLRGVLLSVTSGGATVASTIADGTSAAVAVPDGFGTLAVHVALAGAVGLGAPGASVPLLGTAPTITRALTDPVAGTSTLTWAALTGVTGYVVQRYVGGQPTGQPIEVTSATCSLPAPAVNADQAVTVSAYTDNAGVRVTGPSSPLFPLPTTQPAILGVDFNGTTAAVSWHPAAGATGYVVSVLQSGATQPIAQAAVGASVSRAVVAVTIADKTKACTVVVQAQADASSGPPSAPEPLFSPGLFLSTDPASVKAPYLYPGRTLELAPADTTIHLPDLGLGSPVRNLPLTEGAFTLAASANATFPYTVTIPGTSAAWTFGPAPIREQLQADWVGFLTAAEAAGVVPWGIAALQQAVSRAMPQTFQETLYYAYGLDTVAGHADLRPGMVLRVAFGDYVNVGGTPTSPWLDGYTGGPVVDYEVGSYLGSGGWRVGFDAFVAQLVAAGALVVTAPQSAPSQQAGAGVADSADLFYPGFLQPFFRLFFPSVLASPTGIGSVVVPSGFALAAAPTFAALTTTVNYPAAGNTVAYFRGRSVVKLCVRISVNGVDEVVPIGTTVGNLLERYAQRPPGAAVGLDGLVLERAAGPVVPDATARFEVGRTRRVRFDWGNQAVYGPAREALSLPLLHGDRLTIGS